MIGLRTIVFWKGMDSLVEKDDWRLIGQEKYLVGVTLKYKRYSPPSEQWDHDHCEFCTKKFMQSDQPDIEPEGYTTEKKGRWICKECFNDFKDLFSWEVIE